MADIILQFPEGLKQMALKEAKKCNDALISFSACYGACDLAIEEAKAVGVKKIIHFGHAPFLNADEERRIKEMGIEIEYREFPIEMEFEEVLEKALKELKKFKNIGLVTTVQHAMQVEKMKEYLEKGKTKVFVGKGVRTKYPAQILGCDVGAAQSIADKVDGFLYVGGGLFHVLPLSVLNKKTLLADPFSKQVRWMDEDFERRNKKIRGRSALLAESKKVGILVSTKIGQFNYRLAQELKRKLEEAGKECTILVGNEIRDEQLTNLREFDCFVNTACPRIFEDFDRIVPVESVFLLIQGMNK